MPTVSAHKCSCRKSNPGSATQKCSCRKSNPGPAARKCSCRKSNPGGKCSCRKTNPRSRNPLKANKVDWVAVRKWVKKRYDQLSALDKYAFSHPSFAADAAMLQAEKHFDLPTYGVEGQSDGSGRKGKSYLNTGDSYDLTIVCYTSPSSCRFTVSTVACAFAGDC